MTEPDDLQTLDGSTEPPSDSETPVSPDPAARKRLYRKLGYVVAGFAGLLCLVSLWASAWYFFRIMPDETYTAISGEEWETRNVNLMAFTGPKQFRQAESLLMDEIHQKGKSDNPVPYYLLGELYNMELRTRDAIPRYREAIRLSNRSWFHQNVYRHFLNDAHAKLAILYYENNNPGAALATLKSIPNLDSHPDGDLLHALKDSLENPDRADFHMKLGRNLRHHLRLATARREVEQARVLSKTPQLRMEADNFLRTRMPRHVGSLPALARYYSLAGDSQQHEHDDLWQAATFYEKVVREAPSFEWGYNELAIIYRQLKDYRKAGAYARSAITLNPEFYNSYLTMGDIALDDNDFEQAVHSYERASQLIRQMPDEESEALLVNIENQLGFAYESMDRMEEAIRHYRRAMLSAGHSDDESAEVDYGYAQDAIERVSEALNDKRRAAASKRISSL